MKFITEVRKRQIWRPALLGAALAAASVGGCAGGPATETMVTVELAAQEPQEEAGGPESPESSGLQEPEERVIYVHVCGEVKEPGVYRLAEGSRIYEALREAGGVTQEGAADYLNLAAAAEDGMKIQVPSLSQAALWEQEGKAFPGGPDETASARVNLNTAGKEELMTLRGIGQSRAEDIIRYREANGGFERIEDIMNVSGIKEAAFEKIRDDITV